MSDTPPDWMTKDWLRKAADGATETLPSLAREILRLRAEVAERTRERDAYRKAKQENDERFMTERDAARAEVERLTKRVQSMDSSMEHHVAAQTARLTKERDAAIRDRNEFAASEVERFVSDFYLTGDPTIDLDDWTCIRAAELRKAAPAAVPAIIDEAPGAKLPDVEPKVAFGNVSMSNGMSREAFDRVADATPPVDLHQATLRSLEDRLAAAEKARADADATIEGLNNRLAVAEELAATYAARGDVTAARSQEDQARAKKLVDDIRSAINRNSAEIIGGNTPDYLLAEFLVKCLEVFGASTRARTAWHHGAERAGGAS